MKNISFIYLRSKVGNDSRFKDLEKEKFLNKLNEFNDFNFNENGENIFFIETGGTEEIFKSIFVQYKEPYFILATNANNSLPASLEIATFLKNEGKKFCLIHGKAEEIREQLKTIKFSEIPVNSREFSANLILKNKRYGVVGKPSDWLIASETNYKEVKEKLGATLVDISSEKFLEKIRNAKPILSPNVFKDKLNKKVDQNTLDGALKIYVALKEIIKEENLDGITVRCFDLLDTVKNTSCLALALLNKEGYIATCEGDIPTMLTMAIVREKFHTSSFQVNPSYINIKERYAYFAHCTLPLNMCSSYEFDTHFESGIGLGIKGKLDLEKVTILKINRNLKNYEIFEGTIVSNLNKHNLCRTQIKVQFEEDISEMLKSPNGNHLVIFYGEKKHNFENI